MNNQNPHYHPESTANFRSQHVAPLPLRNTIPFHQGGPPPRSPWSRLSPTDIYPSCASGRESKPGYPCRRTTDKCLDVRRHSPRGIPCTMAIRGRWWTLTRLNSAQATPSSPFPSNLRRMVAMTLCVVSISYKQSPSVSLLIQGVCRRIASSKTLFPDSVSTTSIARR